MKRLISWMLTLALCFTVAGSAAAAETAPQTTAENAAIDPWTYQNLLGKGMDVDWCKTAQGMSSYNQQAPADFKTAGISHVRIRIKDAADETLLTLLDRQISDCLKVGLIPIIAYQADALKNDPSQKNMDKVTDWWRTVAQRYRNVSHLLAFDLVIEVTDALNKQPDVLNALYEQVVSAVRESNPTRIVMISPRLRSDALYLSELRIPSAANGYLMAEWHFYAAGPSKTQERKLWTTGTAQECQLILDKIQLASQWQKETGVPTWVGAWMPGNYNDGDEYSVPEQAAFAAFMTRSLEQANIPFAVNADTHFYDRGKNEWVAEMQPVFAAIYGGQLPFTDVPADAWFYEAAVYVYENQIFSGTSATTFSPNRPMTRAQLWTVLGRMAGENLTGPDVYEAARRWAISAGVSDGSNPQSNLTREQLATILWRRAGAPDAGDSLRGFSDAASVSSYARTAMAWAAEQGVLSGNGGALLPGGIATRAQTAAILQRVGEAV